MTKEEQITIATEILNQLGGKRFTFMTGAKNFGTLTNKAGIGFKVMGGQYIRIVLNSMDTYDIERFKMRKMEKIKVRTEEGIYCDMLCDSFTRLTGLNTSL